MAWNVYYVLNFHCNHLFLSVKYYNTLNVIVHINVLKACRCFFTIILPTHKFENVTTFLSMYFEFFSYNIFWYIINQHTITIEFEIVRNVITSCPCNFENYFALAYTIRTYHGIHDDNITWWNIPHWYKLILIHNKIKQKIIIVIYNICC